MIRPKTFLAALAVGGILLALGAGGGWWWAKRAATPAPMAVNAPAGQGKVLYWYDPMFPQQHFDERCCSLIAFAFAELLFRNDQQSSRTERYRLGLSCEQSIGLGRQRAALRHDLV